MATCNKSWCFGLTGLVSVLALIISVYTLKEQATDTRLTKLEEKNDTIVTLTVDMGYVKGSVARIEKMLQK